MPPSIANSSVPAMGSGAVADCHSGLGGGTIAVIAVFCFFAVLVIFLLGAAANEDGISRECRKIAKLDGKEKWEAMETFIEFHEDNTCFCGLC
jgi:hypothetical protein